jgi:chemotaxis protein CheD
MNSEGVEQRIIYLKAGEMLFAGEPSVVMTVLGSCLTVTMFHRRTGFAGISHALLPRCPKRRHCDASCCGQQAKYVDCIVPWMVRRFTEAGAHLREIEVKVFGGADMFTSTGNRGGVISIGKQNIEAAFEALEKAGLRVLARDVGGTRGRKIFFNTETGEVLLKRLQPNVTLVEEGEMG